MPALSKKQQKFLELFVRFKKVNNLQQLLRLQRQADMKKSDVKKFASTKHKGLPEKK